MSESSFAEFHAATCKQLWAYVFRVLGDAASTDDILQESYIRLLQSGRDELTEKKMKSYLYTIATNLMNDHWRRKKRLGVSSDEEVRAKDLHNDLKMDIAHAFTFLTQQQRSLLWLAYVDGYDHKEIASMLKLGEKSIRVLLFRARKAILAIFQNHGIGLERKVK